MSRDGSGTYSLPAGNPVTTGSVISSTTHNTTMSDIATALTQSIAKDGQTTPTANLPMGGYVHTGVGAATARTHYARAAEVQDGTITHLTSVSGTDTITASAGLSMTAYATGQKFSFVAAGANTGAATININGIGVQHIKKGGTTALAAGDIPSGTVATICYDGTNFQLTNPASISVSLSANNTWTGIQSFDENVTITGAGKGVIFEGTTADANETTLVAGEPTADRTVTLPDATTTLAGLSVAQTFTAAQTISNDLSISGDLILTGAGKGVIFEGTTADAYETTLVAGEPTADRTVTMPDATTTLVGLAVTQTFTKPQRTTRTVDNDGSFDLDANNDFLCTPAGSITLSFTNIPADPAVQKGTVKLVNGSNYAVSLHATTKSTSGLATTLSATGTYMVAYESDGTNVHISCAGAMT